MQSLYTKEDLQAWLSANQNERVVLFKHSTTCPISAAAYEQVIKFEEQTKTPIALVRVIEERALSNDIAAQFGVRHQSPQALVIDHGKVTWHDSHYQITQASLTAATGESEQKYP
jgi:bacillithiol system protein YtxJ